MAEKAITIYTPEGSIPHINADDDAFIHRSFAGLDNMILGSLQCNRNPGLNSVILSGVGGVSNKGYVCYLYQGDNVELPFAGPVATRSRSSLVVAQFTRGGGATSDQHVFAVVDGVAGINAVDPDLTTSPLTQIGDINQVALFRITSAADGSISISAPLLPTAVPIILGEADPPATGIPNSLYVQMLQ